MIDMNTTSSSKSLELTVRAQNALTDLGERVATRMRDQRGQTAAEYLGIVVVVAAIIAAIVGAGLDKKIADALGKAIDSITGK